jgi:hypothetical protein
MKRTECPINHRLYTRPVLHPDKMIHRNVWAWFGTYIDGRCGSQLFGKQFFTILNPLDSYKAIQHKHSHYNTRTCVFYQITLTRITNKSGDYKIVPYNHVIALNLDIFKIDLSFALHPQHWSSSSLDSVSIVFTNC